MPTLVEERATALKSAEDIVNGAKATGRELTPEETKQANDLLAQVDGLDTRIKAAEDSAALMKRLGTVAPAQVKAGEEEQPAPTLGEHFVKHAGRRLTERKGEKGASVSAPEFKAATDSQVTNGGVFTPVLTTVDRTIVRGYRPRLTIADLVGSGQIGANSNAVTYFVEAAREGNFTTVAEGGAKPQIHYVDPTAVTDALKKIAGFIKMSDEMIEDLDFVVSEINGRLLYDLGWFEEQQILAGAGTGTTLTGLLNRSGIQTETGATTADNQDALFRAITKVRTATGLDADAMAIHPTDYQTFRLKKDAQGQYYGGGFFQPPYGEFPGVMSMDQPLWGLRTVVTPAITAGTVLVGAYQQAATLYRKGGIRVESTNSHASDFTSNLVTIRAEERVALAVRVPAAFVKVTLA